MVCPPGSKDSKARVAPGSLPGCLHVAALDRKVRGKKRWQLSEQTNKQETSEPS